MPPVTLSKGFKNGWAQGELGWGSDLNDDLARANALVVDHWANEPSTTVGLVYAFRGGVAVVSNTLTRVAGGTVTLTANQTNYVERTPAGVVSFNTTGWTAAKIPMAKVVTGASTISSIEDWRTPGFTNLLT